jgi:putative flippase GtrA
MLLVPRERSLATGGEKVIESRLAADSANAMAPAIERRTLVQKLTRCMSVSVLTTVISVSILATGTAVFGIAAWLANVIATSVATVPSYGLNRRWTWGRRDASDPVREILPFWALSFAGLALSTIAVGAADSWAAAAGLTGLIRTAAIVVAHLSGFGVLWVAQFVLLDRVLFGRTAPTSLTPPATE